jgi:hypothetical protein
MVSRQDVRTLNEQSRELQAALDEMRDLHEAQQNENVTVDPQAFADAQARVKEAVTELAQASDGVVDRTDVFEPDDEEAAPVELPEAALSRDGPNTTLPDSAGGA